jgi:alpha-galactosidase
MEERWRRLADDGGYYLGLRVQTDLHQFDMMLSVCRDMERLCPKAWLVQSSNPVFEGCTLMTRETDVRVVGLCHGFRGYRQLAEAIGVPPDEVQWEAVGVNHCIYLTQFRYQGKDLYPKLDEWLATQAADYWRIFRGDYGEVQLFRSAFDHYRRVGLMPIGDAARTFNEWYYHTDLDTKRRWSGWMGGFDSEYGWTRCLEDLEVNLARIRDVATDARARVTAVIPPVATYEIQVPIIEAIVNDRPGIFQVNVPNRGAIAGIADDVVVEGKALVDGSGIRLLQVGKLPTKLMQMVLLPRILKAEKDLAVYLTGDRDLLISYILDDHRTQSLEQAERIVLELLALPWNEPLARRFGEPRAPLPGYDLPDLSDPQLPQVRWQD